MTAFYAHIGAQEHMGFMLEDGNWMDCHPKLGTSIHAPLKTRLVQYISLALPDPGEVGSIYLGSGFSFNGLEALRWGLPRRWFDGPPFVCSEFVMAVLHGLGVKTMDVGLPYNVLRVIHPYAIRSVIRRGEHARV